MIGAVPRRRHMTSSRQRRLAEAVVAMTGRLVGLAMEQHWAAVPQVLRERRGLLDDLEREPRHGAHQASCVAALRSAVAESERVLAQLKRSPGAPS
ncbi:MAG: hypothetical protein MUF07_08035 [Steroidobacteraceae bacterium]|nr:hypothetical protein [Steroidobacteraceae bacterium]